MNSRIGPLAASAPTHYALAESPLGPLLLMGNGKALSGLHFAGHAHAPRIGDDWVEDADLLAPVARQLAEYFAGRRSSFDLVLDLRGTPFQLQVWEALLRIPWGETRSYRDVALELGRPGAFRAVGGAVGSNPVSIVVPCHRVIGAGGRLVGYGWGLGRKRWLLAHEGAKLEPWASPQSATA
jgi:methylated-DNA-[protein]-cysteine S-methyltransferase